MVAARARAASGGSTSRSPTRASAPPAAFWRSHAEHWRSMVLTNVYGAALTIRATLPALKESRGHLLLTGSVAGRRALPGLALLGHEVGGDRRWASRRAGAERHRGPGDADRARDGRHAVLRQPAADALEPEDVARAVMFAVSQPAARRRQRDPRPADGAGRLTQVRPVWTAPGGARTPSREAGIRYGIRSGSVCLDADRTSRSFCCEATSSTWRSRSSSGRRSGRSSRRWSPTSSRRSSPRSSASRTSPA